MCINSKETNELTGLAVSGEVDLAAGSQVPQTDRPTSGPADELLLHGVRCDRSDPRAAQEAVLVGRGAAPPTVTVTQLLTQGHT